MKRRWLSVSLLGNLILVGLAIQAHAQRTYWQQQVHYSMQADMDVHTNILNGHQVLEYWNHSPDTLHQVFYHLYWNAFQPGSMMDVRSRELGKITILGQKDWDSRVRDRIEHLNASQIGYDSVYHLTMDGRPQQVIYHETILQVPLDRPIAPGQKVRFSLDFRCQVPVQIRRSGRDNREGVRYSMSQWYPKLCEYDFEGWHTAPYVAREFYGVWGDYDVSIRIDRHYILGATGYLQHPDRIGYGYEAPGTKVQRPSGPTLTWTFHAPNVHDFVWAADPGYRHLVDRLPDGRTIHFLYKPSPHTDSTWGQLAYYAEKAFPFMEKTFGPYGFRQYSFIQGGDGGMEYPMATLINGDGPLLGLLADGLHEWMHSWYQMMLATNEQEHAWMDEGFTSYAESRVLAYLMDSTQTRYSLDPYGGLYREYIFLAKSGLEEPLTTGADHFATNFAYELGSYAKGAVFMEQLGYIIGQQALDKGLLMYRKTWGFHHPNDNDFIRIMEQASGLQLQWYREYFIQTTKSIDYSIDTVIRQQDGTEALVRLRRIGQMPMPIDLVATYRDGSRRLFYIPNYLSFGIKPNETPSIPRQVLEVWPWTNPTYDLHIPLQGGGLQSLQIDPSHRMADIDPSNNNWPRKAEAGSSSTGQ